MKSLLLAVAVIVSPVAAHAQAWVDLRGDLTLTLRSDYQTSQGVWHGSTLVTGVPAQVLASSVAVQYVPLEKLGLGLTLNGNGTRYSGPQSIPGNSSIILAHGSQDDGNFHWNATDLDFDAHYQAYDGVVAIAPAIRLHTPMTDYENKGYAMSGTQLKEASLGVSLGRIGLGLDELVLQAGYAFTFVEKESGGGMATEKYRTNRSDADLTLAYLITDSFTVSAGAAFRYTHDGFNLQDYPSLPAGDPLIKWHDPVLKVTYVAPIAGATYRLTDAWLLAGRFGAVVWGQNASNPILFGLDIIWSGNLVAPD